MKPDSRQRFESLVLVHLDAAYGLARWLLHDDQRAADATQDACVRAWRHFEGMASESPKAWFLAIVRNVCFDAWNAHRSLVAHESATDEVPDSALLDGEGAAVSPETLALRASDARWLHTCLASLSAEHREVLVLREFEDMSYREISAVVGVPIGTVMSRLARARDMLAAALGSTRRRRAG